MRRGLVAIGMGLVTVGAALMVLGVVNLPGQSGEHYQEALSHPSPVAGGTWFNFTILDPPGTPHTSPPLSVAFAADQPLNVWLSTCAPPANQPPTQCLIDHTQTSRDDGTLWANATLTFPYFLDFRNVGTAGTAVNWTVTIPYTASAGLPLWQAGLVIGGGATLAIIGLVATFLGLFLRTNPYGPEPEPLARDASLPPPEVPEDTPEKEPAPAESPKDEDLEG